MIVRRIVVVIFSLIAVLLVGNALFLWVFRDLLYSINMEKLDSWVKNGGTASTLQSQVVEICGNLVLNQAGAFELIELLTIYRDEFDFRVEVCATMTANRVYKQPQFEKSEIVAMICDDPNPYHELFGRLCSRSGLRPAK